MSEKVKVYQEKMDKTLASLDNEYATIRAGRANPHVLDRIQVGNITVPEPRLLQIQPWDTSLLKEIEKAINKSDIGINPNSDGKVIRLVFPELTEERRASLAKEVKKKGEDAKVAIRNIRRDALDTFKKQEKAHEITEDELADLTDEIQKITDKSVAAIDKKSEAKSKDIMSV